MTQRVLSWFLGCSSHGEMRRVQHQSPVTCHHPSIPITDVTVVQLPCPSPGHHSPPLTTTTHYPYTFSFHIVCHGSSDPCNSCGTKRHFALRISSHRDLYRAISYYRDLRLALGNLLLLGLALGNLLSPRLVLGQQLKFPL